MADMINHLSMAHCTEDQSSYSISAEYLDDYKRLVFKWLNFGDIADNMSHFLSCHILYEGRPIFLYIIESGLFIYKRSLQEDNKNPHDHLAAFILGCMSEITAFAHVNIVDENNNETWNIFNQNQVPFDKWFNNTNNLRPHPSKEPLTREELKSFYDMIIPHNLRLVMQRYDHESYILNALIEHQYQFSYSNVL
ncbi:MAG: hypothetical protein N0E42_12085 [Candidatus Thiodiazotropha endolucinida]|nr:hypothetical protein [Candidatus Thiodiazotropha taylori]MCW4225211.1 hypothetical protein [Candidatus Thiodiazotropha endolucinida]MCG7880763.1 hypothetical protein [Candidatus Thiodiazotropha taylori]MCG7886782.1 hypothetical protein [Candidatus Thiodiazotropha taylori]MCG8030599.1 hypothetical protein [Candidatus Thiodiazotropha taylori]